MKPARPIYWGAIIRIRKPEAQIEILFPDVFPERVPVRHLADALSAIHQLATPDVAEETGALSIRLVDVRRGSAVFRCIADESDPRTEAPMPGSHTALDCSRQDWRIAKVAGATDFYSHDVKCRRLATMAGLSAHDLPTNHPNLFVDREIRQTKD
jgi:hypothetical protein